MDEKRREEFVTAVEEMATRLGAQSYERGLDQAVTLLTRLLAFVESIRTKTALQSLLESMEPPTRSEERKVLFAIRYFPQFVRIASGLAVTKFLASLPAFAPGRPQKIPIENRERVLDFISTLHRKGFSLGVAQHRASQRFGCSIRTVERLWATRAEAPDECATPEEVAEWISQEI